MAKGVTTTKRSLDMLRQNGYQAAIVESWITFPERRNGIPTGKNIRIKRDVWGADILAARSGGHAMLVQTTTSSNQAARLGKVLGMPEVKVWLEAGNLFAIHGWSLRGPRGGRKTWQCSVRSVTLADFAEEESLQITDADLEGLIV